MCVFKKIITLLPTKTTNTADHTPITSHTIDVRRVAFGGGRPHSIENVLIHTNNINLSDETERGHYQKVTWCPYIVTNNGNATKWTDDTQPKKRRSRKTINWKKLRNSNFTFLKFPLMIFFSNHQPTVSVNVLDVLLRIANLHHHHHQPKS